MIWKIYRNSLETVDFSDAVAVPLQCTDPRYLLIYPISLMTLTVTFIITGWAVPDGLGLQMVLLRTDWLSVWLWVYSCRRSHVLLQRSALPLKPSSSASHTLFTITKAFRYHQSRSLLIVSGVLRYVCVCGVFFSLPCITSCRCLTMQQMSHYQIKA